MNLLRLNSDKRGSRKKEEIIFVSDKREQTNSGHVSDPIQGCIVQLCVAHLDYLTIDRIFFREIQDLREHIFRCVAVGHRSSSLVAHDRGAAGFAPLRWDRTTIGTAAGN